MGSRRLEGTAGGLQHETGNIVVGDVLGNEVPAEWTQDSDSSKGDRSDDFHKPQAN